MIFTKVEIDNLYCFSQSVIDLTFPKKLKNSTIKNESLPGRDRFNFKRVCVISGPNASGKTAFAKAMCGIQNFIARKNLEKDLYEAVSHAYRPGSISAEFVTENHELHKLALWLTKGKSRVINS